MGSKRNIIKLKEVVDVITSKVDVSLINISDYISTENMLTDFQGITLANSIPSTGKITKFNQGDILFSNIRTYFKKIWLADRPGACSNDVIVFRPKDNIEPSYIFSVLIDPKFIDHTVLTSKGTKMPRGDKKAILDYEFKLSSSEERKFISKINSIIFEKINCNKLINSALENMSQTLFKSWFVDFDPVIDNALDAGNPIPEVLKSRAELRQKERNSADFKPLPADIRALFPAEFEETELGWVPTGWHYMPLKNLGKIICGKTPDKSNKEYYGEDYLFIKIPDMHGKVFVTNSADKLSTLGSETQIKKLVPKGSICVSCIATVGIVAINSKDCHTNQQINSIVPNSSILRNYLYFSMLGKNKIFHDLASGGSATLNMNTGVFSNVLTLKPEDSVLERFR